ncbi:MAG: hypothetical protein NVSMB52_00030 [Chloroflexota bacterium]
MITHALAWVQARVHGGGPSHDVGLRRVGTRLALQTVVLVLVMLIVLEVVVFLITQHALLGALQTTLKERSNPPPNFIRDVLRLGNGTVLAVGDSGPPPYRRQGSNDKHRRPIDPYLLPSDASTVFVDTRLGIRHGDGALGHRLFDVQSLRTAIQTGQDHCCTVQQYRGRDYLVYTNPLHAHGEVVGAVQSSVSEYQYESTMKALLSALLLVALLGLLGAGGVSVVLVQRALRPIRLAVQRQRDFVADAAHELRTPLAIQRTVAEVALSDVSGENHDATVEQMLVENRHLTKLVDDLSLLARADSHAVAIAPTLMNFSSLVTDTASELEPLAEERGMRLAADVRADVWVVGDIMRLRQLLLVLLDNALKYTPIGGSVEVQLHAGGGRAQLQIKDSGPGIDPIDLPRIFDRFYRADKARTGEGSGLGLAIAKWIVEAHGGNLQARNSTPHGAVLTAVIPVARASA